MSNAPSSRPSTKRKTTRTSETRRREELQQEIAFRVDGKVYGFRLGDLNSFDLMALRRETGMSMASLGQAMEDGDMGIEIIAVFVWLARRAGGEQMLKFEQVAREITLDSDIGMDTEDDDEGEETAGEA